MLMPPRVTNSAVTPSSRRLTSSIKAGGKDHSRPTISPTFKVIGCSLHSIVPVNIQLQHMLPVRPVVAPAIPDAQGVANALAPEDAGKMLVAWARNVVASNCKNDVLMLQRLNARCVVFVLDEINGIIEINGIVIIAIGPAPNIIRAAEANGAVNPFRVAQGEVDGVVRAKAGSGGHQEGVGVAVVGKGQHFLVKILIVLVVAGGALCRWPPFGIPAFAVHAVHAVELNPALFQVFAQRGNHAPVFPIVEAAIRGGEGDQTRPGMPEDQQLHLPPKRRTIPAVVLTIHKKRPLH